MQKVVTLSPYEIDRKAYLRLRSEHKVSNYIIIILNLQIIHCCWLSS